jgi:hypothetical protein
MLSQPAESGHPYRGVVDRTELPDLHGWGWNSHSPLHYDCGTTAVTAWRQPADETEPAPGEDRFAYVFTDPAEYLLAHGVREIGVPQYYSRFRDEFEPVVAEWTIRRHGRAVGVDAGLLERTVRLAEGKGRIDHDALSLYLCDNCTLLVTGSRGAFLVDVTPLKRRTLDRTPPDSTRIDVDDFAVPEADPDYQLGLRRFVTIFEEHTNATLARYKHSADGKHVFETSDGEDVYAGQKLQDLARMVVDETELRRVHTYDLNGKTHQSVWDSDTATRVLNEQTRLGAVVGFEHAWNQKEHIMSNSLFELQSQARYWCFQPRPEMYSYYDFEIRSLDENIDTFANGT